MILGHIIASIVLLLIGAILGYSRQGYSRKALTDSYDRGFAKGREEGLQDAHCAPTPKMRLTQAQQAFVDAYAGRQLKLSVRGHIIEPPNNDCLE